MSITRSRTPAPMAPDPSDPGPGPMANPNWILGFVPPNTEWNNWFSQKVDWDDPSVMGGPFVPLSGGNMNGLLFLSADPTLPMGAVTKQYVDSLTFAAGPFMPQSGGTFTGPVVFNEALLLTQDPTLPLGAATKQYVDASTLIANNGLTIAQAAVRRTGDTMTGALMLSGNPVAPLGAVPKQYADLFMPIAGGQFSGEIATIAGVDIFSGRALYATSVLYVNAFNNWEWAFYTDASGDKIQNYRATHYDQWSSATGQRLWVGGNQVLMDLDTAGTLNVLNSVNTTNVNMAGALSVSSNASVGGTTFTNALAINTWSFYNNGGSYIQQYTSGWYDQWIIADGTRFWVNGNTVVMSMTPQGAMFVPGGLNAGELASGGGVYASGGLFANAANDFALYVNPDGSRILNFSPNHYFDLDPGGSLHWYTPNGPLLSMDVDNNLTGNFVSYLFGIGAYANFSDERGKNYITPANVGLDQVLAIEPIHFTRLGRLEPEIGFSAQQLAGVIPEAVMSYPGAIMPGIKEEDATSEPALLVSIEPIIAALVNGMKELQAQLDDLRGRT